MEKIRELLGKPLITAVLGFVLGLIIGLPILGWGLWPVKWVDASAEFLRADLRADYLRMAVESFGQRPDEALAMQRFKELGAKGSEALTQVAADPTVNSKTVQEFSRLVQVDVAPAAPAEQGTPEAGAPVVPAAPAAESGGPNFALLLGIFCVLTLVIGAILLYFLVLRKRSGGGVLNQVSRQAHEASRTAARTDFEAEGQEAPIAQFMTTYMLGDDLYDDSFSIDSPSGEFLGECGVGISETVGVGDPKKVTAFEVWLFDKNDIQTVTKVLMSRHAFEDLGLNQRLASKGEPVLLEPKKRILLETKTLQLEARIADMSYGQGPVGDSAFFDRVTLELAIWPKAG